MNFFFLLIACVYAGFCDHKSDGWHCDFDVAKRCDDGNKVSERRCSFRCEFGNCRGPRFCEVQKIPNPQLLSHCRGIVVYSIDDSTNVQLSDSNAKTYSEVISTYTSPPATAPPTVNGTTGTQPTETPHPADGIDCSISYTKLSCYKEFINCADRNQRSSCKGECIKVNLCNTRGIQLECDKICSGSILRIGIALLAMALMIAIVS